MMLRTAIVMVDIVPTWIAFLNALAVGERIESDARSMDWRQFGREQANCLE